MLAEFIDFVDSILPAVSPDFRDGAKNAILQFEKEGHTLNYLTTHKLDVLSQGDILSNVPFTYFEGNGEQYIFVANAMIISTSCHIDQKKKLVLVPILPLSSFNGSKPELQKNTIFDYMYIPDVQMADKYVDFSILCTYKKELILEGLKQKKIKQIASLNQLGYYLFIVKLSVYLMRKEDNGTLQERQQNLFS